MIESGILARGLVKTYKTRRVVNEIDIGISKGEIVGLLGANGAGKTTTFYMIVGFVKPDKGRVYLNGQDITSVPMYRRARMGIGYLSQEPSVFRKLTVLENLLLVLEFLPLSYRERKEKAYALLEEFSITHLANNKGYALSGGERRRVEIARTLAIDPSFILLDEPFTGIDPITITEIKEIIRYLREEKNIGVLITDHNVRETLNITDRAYIMHDGNIIASGTPEVIANEEKVRKHFLGKDFVLL